MRTINFLKFILAKKLSLILNSDLVSPKDLEEKELKYPKKITKEHHDKLMITAYF